MTWNDLENAFNRALASSVLIKKLIVTFPFVLVSGVLTVFCRALAQDATAWISLSLKFLPVFLSSGVFLSLGVILSRIYLFDQKQIPWDIRLLFKQMIDLILGVFCFALPLLFLYIVMAMVLGLFFLLKEIPGVGEFLSVLLSSFPFLLIFAMLLLSFLILIFLFFVSPLSSLEQLRRLSFFKQIFVSLKNRFLSSFVLLCISLLPFLFVFFLISFSFSLLNTNFFLSTYSLSIAMQELFLMIPVCALLTPPTLFFFSFSSESHHRILCVSP